jgi:hypothetical protein
VVKGHKRHFDEVEEDDNMDIDHPYEGDGPFKRQMKKKGRDLGPSYFNMEIDFIFQINKILLI